MLTVRYKGNWQRVSPLKTISIKYLTVVRAFKYHIVDVNSDFASQAICSAGNSQLRMCWAMSHNQPPWQYIFRYFLPNPDQIIAAFNGGVIPLYDG